MIEGNRDRAIQWEDRCHPQPPPPLLLGMINTIESITATLPCNPEKLDSGVTEKPEFGEQNLFFHRTAEKPTL